MAQKLISDAVNWYMSDITSRIVAESGIPTDRYHLGKIILQCLKDDPDALIQIDGATGDSDTNATLIEKTVKCAICLKKFGLKVGDVIVLMAPNHLELSVAFYAALYTGIVIAAVDSTLGINEVQKTFSVSEPKIIFCQSEKAPDVQIALNEIDSNANIITFDKGHNLYSFSEFIDNYTDNTMTEEFRPTDFDPEVTAAFLISTSGTTGLPKAAEVTHKNLAITLPTFWCCTTKFPSPTRMALIVSSLHWLSVLFNYLAAPIFKYTKLHSSLPMTQEHAFHLIDTYKPTFTLISPAFMTTLIKGLDKNQCDFSCFELIVLVGSAVSLSLLEDCKKISPHTEILNVYGMSEIAGLAFYGDTPSSISCGKPLPCFQYRIVDVEMQKDIDEPNVPGELWITGPSIFKGYYKNQEATDETFEDRWFKTGDTFYRDESWNFYFVDRIKLLLKYKNYQISPLEVETVIRQHPGVLDAVVTSVSDPECGDLPVGCVVIRDGYNVTADDIKGLVKESLSDAKQLRGGVVFLESIPMTASTKVHRRKLKEIVQNTQRL